MPGPKGLRVYAPQKPAWGVGQVLADDGGAAVTVFFLAGGRRTVDTTRVELDLVTGKAAASAILDIAERVNWEQAHHNLYVVELDPAVLGERRFREANLKMDARNPCVYVGLTGGAPAERLQKHQAGYKASRYVHRYGRRLLPSLFKHFNPMPYELAAAMEVELARQLRERGYGVWQN